VPQSTMLGLHRVIHVPNYMDHYSFTDHRVGWLSWPCWLTGSGWLNCKVVTHPASSLEQDRESSPAETSVLTTMLRRQPCQNQHNLPSSTAKLTVSNRNTIL